MHQVIFVYFEHVFMVKKILQILQISTISFQSFNYNRDPYPQVSRKAETLRDHLCIRLFLNTLNMFHRKKKILQILQKSPILLPLFSHN